MNSGVKGLNALAGQLKYFTRILCEMISVIFLPFKVVRIAARKACRCHGLTASCAMKTCSRNLLNFLEVGKLLKGKYDHAVRVKYTNNAIKPFHDTGSRLETGRHGSLAYFYRSPNYCQPDRRTGFPGMQGRNSTHDNAQKFNSMCTSCKLNLKNKAVMERVKCQCQFVWCCHVNCDTCEKQLNVTICS